MSTIASAEYQSRYFHLESYEQFGEMEDPNEEMMDVANYENRMNLVLELAGREIEKILSKAAEEFQIVLDSSKAERNSYIDLNIEFPGIDDYETRMFSTCIASLSVSQKSQFKSRIEEHLKTSMDYTENEFYNELIKEAYYALMEGGNIVLQTEDNLFAEWDIQFYRDFTMSYSIINLEDDDPKTWYTSWKLENNIISIYFPDYLEGGFICESMCKILQLELINRENDKLIFSLKEIEE